MMVCVGWIVFAIWSLLVAKNARNEIRYEQQLVSTTQQQRVPMQQRGRRSQYEMKNEKIQPVRQYYRPQLPESYLYVNKVDFTDNVQYF